ncbi:MAG: ATP-binding cassette domain-containing protein [Bacteroidia bacterium]|jgi:ABC-2 type transport system ATP-binding protein
MSIQVQSITKTYGSQKALDQVSFSIQKGEIVGFLGPNGAGKSTMMKILTGFIPADSGLTSVAGFNIQTQPLEVKRRVGYLPESNPLYPDMYVKEFLRFIGRLHGLSGAKLSNRVSEMIEVTGLGREQHKRTGALSKGYKQRVGLAAALIHDPEVVILDEPTSGFDPNQLVEIRHLIRGLAGKKTVLLSSHILQEVQAVCQRVLILDQGRLVEDAPIDALGSRSKGGIVWLAEFEEDLKQAQLQSIPGIQRVQALDGKRWHLLSETEKGMAMAISRWAIEQGITLNGIQKESRSLEEVFREKTGRQHGQP